VTGSLHHNVTGTFFSSLVNHSMICVQMRHEYWTRQGSLSCSPWQSVCHNRTATDATHSCTPVSHSAHDSLFATTEQLQMPHTAVCQSPMQPMTVCLPQLNSYICHTQLYASLSCSPWQSVCHNWTATDATYSCMPASRAAHDSLKSYRCHTQLYARLWNYLSSYSKLVDLCMWILFICYHNMKASCMVVFRDEGTFETTAAMLSRESRTNSLTWGVMWFYPIRHVLK